MLLYRMIFIFSYHLKSRICFPDFWVSFFPFMKQLLNLEYENMCSSVCNFFFSVVANRLNSCFFFVHLNRSWNGVLFRSCPRDWMVTCHSFSVLCYVSESRLNKIWNKKGRLIFNWLKVEEVFFDFVFHFELNS